MVTVLTCKQFVIWFEQFAACFSAELLTLPSCGNLIQISAENSFHQCGLF